VASTIRYKLGWWVRLRVLRRHLWRTVLLLTDHRRIRRGGGAPCAGPGSAV